MTYENIFDALNSTVWAIHPDKFEQISAFISGLTAKEAIDAAFEADERFPAADFGDDEELGLYGELGIKIASNGTAIVPIQGTMMKRMNMFSRLSGGTSTEMLTKAVHMLEADERVRRVAFHIDSPGGSVDGLSDLRDAIRGMSKPTVSLGDGMMASAAYFVGSAADKVYATKDALVGSIGVITSRWDYSEAYGEAGIKQHIWRSGPYKALGYPSEPLSTDESKETQRMVDSYFRNFVQVVAENRFNGNLEQAEALADGRVYVGAEAVTNNLVDGIKNIEEIEAELSAEATFEDKYNHLAAEYETAVTSLAEKDALIEAKDAKIADLVAQLEAQQTAALSEKADKFIAELIEDGKIAAAADHSALRENLVANFDAFSSVFAAVPKGIAAPGEVKPSTEATPTEAVEAKVAEAKAAGVPIALTEEEAEVYADFGRTEGTTDPFKHFVKGYHE